MDAKTILAFALGGGVVYYLMRPSQEDEDSLAPFSSAASPGGRVTSLPAHESVQTNPLVVPPIIGIGALVVAFGLVAYYTDPYRSK